MVRVVLSFGLGLFACNKDEACPPGTMYVRGMECVAVPPGGGAASDAAVSPPTETLKKTEDAGLGAMLDGPGTQPADGSGPATSDAAAVGAGNWGASCGSDADCKAGLADYCAIQPGSVMGYCSKKGCAEAPSACPSGWSCLNIPGILSTCRKP